MVARSQVRCTAVALPVSTEFGLSRGALARDVLPWADPYVAQLIRKLQEEVRQERRMKSLLRRRLSDSFFAAPVYQVTQLGGQEE
jgi:hypothetical protein